MTVPLSVSGRRTYPDTRVAVLLFFIAAGILLRFANLGLKHYWHDEAWTSLTAVGTAVLDIDWSHYRGREIPAAELVRDLQTPSPDKGYRAVIDAHVRTQVYAPPLYFLLLQAWMRTFGAAPAQVRAFSALLGVLALPAAFWLTQEMGWHKGASLLAAAMLALSPFQITYAQEARQYSMLTLMTLVASALLFHALAHRRPVWWPLYALTLVAGLYTHLLFLIVVATHAVYMLIRYWLAGRRRLPRAGSPEIGFLLSALVAALAFVPWLLLILRSSSEEASWLARPIDPALRLAGWGRNVSALFVDTNPLPAAAELVLASLIALLAVACLVYVARSWRRDGNLFVLLLFVINLAPLMLLDLLWGGQRTTTARYLVFSLLALQLAIAWTLADSLRHREAPAFLALTAVLLALGLFSATGLVLSPAAMGKGNDELQVRVLAALNEEARPLVLLEALDSSPAFGDVLGLSHDLHNGVRFFWLPAGPLALPEERDALYFYLPSAAALEQLEAGGEYGGSEVVPGLLWKLVPGS